jgi:hypothetical protein
MGRLSRTHMGRPAITQRFMSVINLSDLDATEKFRQLNHKSILYFTATW